VMRWRLKHSSHDDELPIRTWGYPYLTIVSIVAMVSIAVAMVFDDAVRSQVLVSTVVTALVVGAALVWQRRRPAGHVAAALPAVVAPSTEDSLSR
jgi:GABA permease